MKLVRSQSTHSIDDAFVYRALQIGSSSKDCLNVPAAFDFAKEQSSRLQSLGEALVVRVAFHNDSKGSGSETDNSNDDQQTSTVSLKFENDGSFNIDASRENPYVTVFVELDCSDADCKLWQEGYDANSKGKNLIKPVKDRFICDLIARAKEAGRVVPALMGTPLKLATAQVEGKSAYGQHPNVVAAFGNSELAELNASYLSERGYETGYLHDFTTQEIKMALKGKENNAIVQAVGLGGFGVFIFACQYFSSKGYARGIIHTSAQETLA